jgi:uncharacterized membrane protein
LQAEHAEHAEAKPAMMSFWLLVVTAVASALMGGIFFGFSSFIMPSLGRIPPEEAIRAMQRINIDVFHWSFMGLFFGIPIACVAIGAQAIVNWDAPGATSCLAGSVAYILGTFLVTAAGNVPLNNALAKFDSALHQIADRTRALLLVLPGSRSASPPRETRQGVVSKPKGCV